MQNEKSRSKIETDSNTKNPAYEKILKFSIETPKSDHDYIVLNCLVRFAMEHGLYQFNSTEAEIMEWSGLSQENVSKALDRITASGLIYREETYQSELDGLREWSFELPFVKNHWTAEPEVVSQNTPSVNEAMDSLNHNREEGLRMKEVAHQAEENINQLIESYALKQLIHQKDTEIERIKNALDADFDDDVMTGKSIEILKQLISQRNRLRETSRLLSRQFKAKPVEIEAPQTANGPVQFSVNQPAVEFAEINNDLFEEVEVTAPAFGAAAQREATGFSKIVVSSFIAASTLVALVAGWSWMEGQSTDQLDAVTQFNKISTRLAPVKAAPEAAKTSEVAIAAKASSPAAVVEVTHEVTPHVDAPKSIAPTEIPARPLVYALNPPVAPANVTPVTLRLDALFSEQDELTASGKEKLKQMIVPFAKAYGESVAANQKKEFTFIVHSSPKGHTHHFNEDGKVERSFTHSNPYIYGLGWTQARGQQIFDYLFGKEIGYYPHKAELMVATKFIGASFEKPVRATAGAQDRAQSCAPYDCNASRRVEFSF